MRAGLAVVLSVVLLIPNARLYAPMDDAGRDEAQLAFLGAALRGGAGERMQALFPEGYFFSWALYGLSWVQAGRARPELREQALREARAALGRLETEAGRAPFSATLDPPLGVFHAGWSAWLAGGVLLLQPAGERDPGEVADLERRCGDLAAAFDRSASPFLQAYPGQAWPVDSTVAVAALRLHDELLAPRFGGTVERWLREARARLDPATGLLPHRADADSGQPLEGARGSSQSVIARFLVEIDPALARVHYRAFREQFVPGLPGVREYPRGVDGAGDVDSGPLVAGISASASVVTLGAARVHGDAGLAGPLAQAAEAAGVPVESAGQRRYAFGLVPVGDAFLLWSRTAQPWVAPHAGAEFPPVLPGWWRLPWHAGSALVAALAWLPLILRRQRTRGPVGLGELFARIRRNSAPNPGLSGRRR